MAWFEVTQLILKSSGACLPSHQPGSGMEQREEQEENEVEENGQSVETCTLLVQYNPAGVWSVYTVKPPNNGHVWDQPFCPLLRGCPLFGG